MLNSEIQATVHQLQASESSEHPPIPAVSLGDLVRRFWRYTTLTWTLVLLEGACLVAFPLVIGWAVDDLLGGSSAGLIQLALLCGLLLVIGSGRRFFDTRAYARIYRTVCAEMVVHEARRKSSLSKISARAGLFNELIDFLEESIPAVLQQLINLVGTLAIVALINVKIFFACLAGMVFTAVVYGLSEQRIFRLNSGANDELERQVEVLGSSSPRKIRRHLKSLMGWRIKLSDLETLNYGAIWIGLGLLLIYTVAEVASADGTGFGQIVATVMYVFGFIESTLVLPFYFQQLVRLQEITSRLGGLGVEGSSAAEEAST